MIRVGKGKESVFSGPTRAWLSVTAGCYFSEELAGAVPSRARRRWSCFGAA